MRKFLFILLVSMVGALSLMAAPLHPPGESSLEMVMSDYGLMAMPATVLVLAQLSQAQPTSFLAFPDNYFTGQMHGSHIIKPTGYCWGDIQVSNEPDYWPRL
jgi:hypothetical protein